MVCGIFLEGMQGKQFMDQVEIEFCGAPVMLAGEDLGYLSADDGMKPEAFEPSKEFDRF